MVCEERDDPAAPPTIGAAGTGETLPVFGFQEEALLYLGLSGGDGLRVRRLPAERLRTLLLGRWSGFDSVALDPLQELDAGPAPTSTTMSRSRFVRFLASYRDGAIGFRAAAAS
ncbi:hypothetical protein GBA63_15745 [Rubrobacter tropicus]|uniref:Uncharacterized protein n=1 Tax=Rubrobacter tropicus TaxID=2653851 RepID=A0A6G8QBR5_9ACTN|nr:hypothetical protein GBA63_15745 [Rubrobacter tropicus]